MAPQHLLNLHSFGFYHLPQGFGLGVWQRVLLVPALMALTHDKALLVQPWFSNARLQQCLRDGNAIGQATA